MARLLQVIGVVAVLGLVGGAIAGFAVLKDRVRIVIADDSASAAPDPTALLRDDVQVLARRFEQLQRAVADNFGQLATGIEQGASARHRDVEALRREVTALHEDARERLEDRDRAGEDS